MIFIYWLDSEERISKAHEFSYILRKTQKIFLICLFQLLVQTQTQYRHINVSTIKRTITVITGTLNQDAVTLARVSGRSFKPRVTYFGLKHISSGAKFFNIFQVLGTRNNLFHNRHMVFLIISAVAMELIEPLFEKYYSVLHEN